jgi:hypothetical protein
MAGAFHASKYSWQSCFYCGCPHGIKQEWQLVNEWCRENHYSVNQVRTLLRKRYLFGLRHKNRMYVMKNPEKEMPVFKSGTYVARS